MTALSARDRRHVRTNGAIWATHHLISKDYSKCGRIMKILNCKISKQTEVVVIERVINMCIEKKKQKKQITQYSVKFIVTYLAAVLYIYQQIYSLVSQCSSRLTSSQL